MAEREGFEPSKQLPVYTLSKRAPSATRPPLLFSNQLFVLEKNVLFYKIFLPPLNLT